MNISAGAITGFASVVTSVIVVVTLLWLTPLLYHLPQATLAAVIMMAVVGLINVKAVKHAWLANKQDGIVAVVSFVLTLAFAPHLDKGILIGAGLALILYLYRTMQPRIAVLARHADGTLRDAEMYGLQACENIAIIRFDGSLYFANTSYFEDKVLERIAAKPDLKYVIVIGDGINQIDASGEEMMSHTGGAPRQLASSCCSPASRNRSWMCSCAPACTRNWGRAASSAPRIRRWITSGRRSATITKWTARSTSCVR